MRTLLLSCSAVDKPLDGSKIRCMALIQCLEQHGPVDALHFADLNGGAGVPLPPPPSRWERLFSLSPAMILRFRSAQFTQELERQVQRGYDLCLLSGLQMLQYARVLPQGLPVWADVYNVESDILARLAHRRQGLKRWHWQWQAWKLRRYERLNLGHVDRVLAISRPDALRMQKICPTARLTTIPHTLPLQRYLAVQPRPLPGNIVFVGALNWHVNVEAVCWMARQVLPRLRTSRPDVHFTVVGRNPDPDVLRLEGTCPGVRVCANVPDVIPYLEEAQLVVAPLLFGSGVQTKVIEALAAGRPVVTTPIGFEGLELDPGEDLRVAEGSDAFARACEELLQEPEQAETMALRARKKVAVLHTQERMQRHVDRLLSEQRVPGI